MRFGGRDDRKTDVIGVEPVADGKEIDKTASPRAPDRFAGLTGVPQDQ
jgi:hypothetical protein